MDPKAISPRPAVDVPLATPLDPARLPQLGAGPSPFSNPQEERTRPSALLLLIPLFIVALLGGGVWAWLQSGVPKKEPVVAAIPSPDPVVVVPASLPKTDPPQPPVLAKASVRRPLVRQRPRPAAILSPASTDLVALDPKAPRRELHPFGTLDEEAPAGPPSLRARLSLEGGGDPSVIEVRVHSDSQWVKEGLHPDADGKLIIAVPKREGLSVLGTAPGYAFATDSVDLKRSPNQEAVLMLERIKQYPIHVAQLDAPVREREPLTVEAGQIWRGIEFSQKGGELYAMGKTCVCIMHPLGKLSEDALTNAVAPNAEPMHCFFAMRVGEGFLVRPHPDEGWVVLRLAAPGVEGQQIPRTGRRVVTSKSSQ